MMKKSRRETTSVSGESLFWAGSSPGPTNKFSQSVPSFFQETQDEPTGWPLVRPYIVGNGKSETEADRLMTEVFSRFDYGGNFRTESSRLASTLSNVELSPTWSNNLFKAYINHQGPVFLAGFNQANALSVEADWSQNFQIMFGLGGTAIARCRPNKPLMSLPVAVGELKKDGLPTILGSLMRRSQNVRDVFRNGGREYLNVQFGWLPLIRDVTALAQTAAQSRKILEQYQKDVDKLVRRRYHFDPTISTTTGLSMASNPSSYWLPSGTPLGSLHGVAVKNFDSLDQVSEVTRVTTKSWFSGGFRFYHRDVAEGLEYFARIEQDANTLLGTRLDPEVLWNLAPWTWLIDWFVNVGDVVGNLSAIIADGTVMQHGYIMRTVTLDKVITLPGLYIQTNAGWRLASGSWDVTQTRVQKARAKASPFGFGLNPSDFSSDQWAILGALGMSRGIH